MVRNELQPFTWVLEVPFETTWYDDKENREARTWFRDSLTILIGKDTLARNYFGQFAAALVMGRFTAHHGGSVSRPSTVIGSIYGLNEAKDGIEFKRPIELQRNWRELEPVGPTFVTAMRNLITNLTSLEETGFETVPLRDLTS
jgi:hypothetical protein